MSDSIPKIGRASCKKVDRPFPLLIVDCARNLGICKKRVNALLQMVGEERMNEDRRSRAIHEASGLVRDYLASVPTSQRLKYGEGNPVVAGMIYNIYRTKEDMLGDRR